MQSGEPQHVLGHALAPLAASFGARECLAELLRVLVERGDAFVLATQLVAELAVRFALPTLDLTHELGHLVELAGHGDELLVDQRLLPVELGARAHAFLLERRLVGLEEPAQRLVVGVALLVGQAGTCSTRGAIGSDAGWRPARAWVRDDARKLRARYPFRTHNRR